MPHWKTDQQSLRFDFSFQQTDFLLAGLFGAERGRLFGTYVLKQLHLEPQNNAGHFINISLSAYISREENLAVGRLAVCLVFWGWLSWDTAVEGGKDGAFKRGWPSLDQHWYADHRYSESQKGMTTGDPPPHATCGSFW